MMYLEPVLVNKKNLNSLISFTFGFINTKTKQCLCSRY